MNQILGSIYNWWRREKQLHFGHSFRGEGPLWGINFSTSLPTEFGICLAPRFNLIFANQPTDQPTDWPTDQLTTAQHSTAQHNTTQYLYGMVWYSRVYRPTRHSIGHFGDDNPEQWCTMYISHSVMESQRHNNPLNPHCFCLQRPKRDGTSS